MRLTINSRTIEGSEEISTMLKIVRNSVYILALFVIANIALLCLRLYLSRNIIMYSILELLSITIIHIVVCCDKIMSNVIFKLTIYIRNVIVILLALIDDTYTPTEASMWVKCRRLTLNRKLIKISNIVNVINIFSLSFLSVFRTMVYDNIYLQLIIQVIININFCGIHIKFVRYIVASIVAEKNKEE